VLGLITSKPAKSADEPANWAHTGLPAAFFCTAKRSKSPSRPEEKSDRLCCGCPMGRIETRRSPSPAWQFALIHRAVPCSGGFF